MSKVVVIGSVGVDLLAAGVTDIPVGKGDEFTETGLTVLPTEPILTVGGNGGNTAYVLGELGVSTLLISSMGEGPLADLASGWLEGAGVEFHNLGGESTSTNLVLSSAEGDRMSYFFPVSADEEALLAQWNHLKLSVDDFVLITGFPHPSMPAIIEILNCDGSGPTTLLDVGPTNAGFSMDQIAPLLSRLDWLVGSETEICGLTGSIGTAVPTALAELRCGVVVKNGPRGAQLHTREARRVLDCDALTNTFTVGAGDTFNAGFLAGLAAGAAPAQAAQFGVDVASVMLEVGGGVLGFDKGKLNPSLRPMQGSL